MNKGIGSAAAKLVVFAIIVAACTGFIVTALRTPIPGDKVAYEAIFTDVSGLFDGDSVRLSGVAVGKVESVDLEQGRARVRFTVDATRPLYDNTQAAVRYQNLIGQRYVELLPGKPGGVKLPTGAVIPVERTIPSFDVSKLFNGFRPLFETLEPEQLNQFGTNLLRVIQGDGSGIGPVLADLDKLTKHAKSSEGVIVLLIQNLGAVSEEIGGKSAAVGALVNQLSEILRNFTDQMANVIVSIEKGDRVLGPLIPLLEQGRDAYDVAYGPLDGLLRRVVPQTDQLTQVLALTPGLVTGLNQSLPGEGYKPRITCSNGETQVPGIGTVILDNQNLVVCK
ncbi:MCE family protein [Nocardia uniformis]|uniref:MCE family protein n=1 Tax=Nocardia uniformis TaxID=53432 RepID=A0A849C002_9NOCA|nr:MlaD family protein [Nocardia uniformis]NNH70756.1 MCE family protein [Nocardia uniformis]